MRAGLALVLAGAALGALALAFHGKQRTRSGNADTRTGNARTVSDTDDDLDWFVIASWSGDAGGVTLRH